jgi:hypothetical protein
LWWWIIKISIRNRRTRKKNIRTWRSISRMDPRKRIKSHWNEWKDQQKSIN